MKLRSFFAELKRRNVYKVAVAYVIAAWLLIQISTQTFPFFEIPNWATRLVILLLIFGFPIALIIAWAFELTPEGIKRSEEVSPNDSITHRTGRKLLVVTAASAAVAAALLTHQVMRSRTAPTSRHTPADSEKSIAVLPFASLSEDKANAYFADGIQDEILTRLSKIGELKVISRTSTQQYQSKLGNLADIAKQLGVAHILEGSVQKAGESVRVNVQLIKGDHDSHVWAETYDRKLTDIFAVESEIAQKIAESLAAHLSGREREAITNVPTQNQEAYDNYLRAGALLNKQGHGQLTKARHALERAIELDPDYAQAWARLAVAESEIYFGGAPAQRDHTPQQLERARRAAETAMRLQPNLSESHLGLGIFYYYCVKDFDRALSEFAEARKLDPNNAYVIFATGLVKRRQGKLDDALKLQHEALVLDPRNSDMWVNLARSYCAQREYVRAREMYDRAIALAPDESDIIAEKADTFITEGNPDAAEAVVAQADTSVLGSAFGTRLSLCLLRRQHDCAIEMLTRSVNAEESTAASRARDQIDLSALQLARNDPAGRRNIEQARAELLALRKAGDTAPETTIGLIDAAAWLGDRATLDREGEALLRESRHDHWQMPRAQVAVARAYAAVHDADRAIPLLTAALAAPSDDTPTPALLCIDPKWDAIREDPRFRKLCAGGTR